MAEPTARELGEWILANQDKADTPEFDAVARAYDTLTLGHEIERPKTSPARKAGQEFVRTSPWAPLVGGVNQAAQGASFGFGDEIGGAASVVADPLHPVQQYQKGRDYLRGVSDQFGKEYPGSALLADVSGGSLYGGPFAKALQAMSTGRTVGPLGRVAQSSAIGAGAGATAGAGRAEDFSSIPLEASKGAAFGAAASPVLQGVGMAGGGAIKSLTPFFTGAAARDRALERVATSIARDQKTSGQVGARMDKLGGEARIVDAAGQSTRDLLDTMSTLPGMTRDKVEQFIRMRQAGRPQRMDVLPEALNQGNRAAQTVETLTRVQQHTAKPLYAAVDNRIVPITPKLESLFDRPAFREAYEQAATNAANLGKPIPTLEEILQQGPVGGLPVKVWDSIKRGFDDVIAKKKRGLDTPSPTNKNQAQSTLQSALDIKHEMVSEIDALTGGAYKAARDAFAGPAALKSALEDGQSIFSMKTSELTETLSKMSRSEQEAFRIGAGEAMREKVGSPRGQAELLNAWKDRNLREKLQAIYGDATTYRTALSKIFAEERLRRLESTGRGSQTARREAGVEDFNLGAAQDAAAALAATKSGNVAGLLQAVRNASSRVATPEPVRNEIGNILLRGGQAGKDELAKLDEIIRIINEKNAGQAAFSGVLGPQLFR